VGTAVLPARRRLDIPVWTVAPSALALAFGLLYWLAAGGCVERAGRWTRVIAAERGFMRLSTRFAPERILDHGRRCDDG
jgi:hypothetical protein